MFQKRLRLGITTTLLALGLTAISAKAAEPANTTEPERWSVLTVFGEDKCPDAAGDEIVVCVKAPEGDRYRVPKNLRKSDENPLAAQSWNAAVESLDETARPMRPNSCSAVGSGGSTGCVAAALRQWFAERRASRK